MLVFFCFCQMCVSSTNLFKEVGSGSVALTWVDFFHFEFNFCSEDSCLYWGVILGSARIFKCREPESVVLLLGFIRSEKLV